MLNIDVRKRYTAVFEKEFFFNEVAKQEVPLEFISCEEKYVAMDNLDFKLFTSTDYYQFKRAPAVDKKSHLHGSFYTSIINLETYQLVMTILDNTSKYYHESQILKLLNNTVLDEHMYNSISEMLKSKDISTKGMAIDLMANCDFEKSIIYLCALLFDHTDEFFKCRERNSVNFKSLLSYLGLKSPKQVSTHNIVRIVRGKNLLTEDNEKILKKILLKHINGLNAIPADIDVTDIKFVYNDSDG